MGVVQKQPRGDSDSSPAGIYRCRVWSPQLTQYCHLLQASADVRTYSKCPKITLVFLF